VTRASGTTPWPHVDALAGECRAAGYGLRRRLPIYPAYVDRPGFLAPALRARVAAAVAGLADEPVRMKEAS